MKKIIHLTVNRQEYEIAVKPNQTLLDVLRKELGLTGAKRGCELGDCGSCTVIMDGKPVNSCLILALEAENSCIETIEGLAMDNQLHPVQETFVEKGAIQCGFCSPGMILSSKHLLDHNQDPTDEEIREAIAGNLCRCTGYQKIIQAVHTCAEKIQHKE